MDAGAWTSLASVLVAAIAAAAAFASQRAAANASVKNAATTSRVDIEKEAFERAKNYYAGALDRQDREIEGLHADVDRLEHKVRELEVGRDEDRRLIDQRDEQIRTYASLLAARGIDLP